MIVEYALDIDDLMEYQKFHLKHKSKSFKRRKMIYMILFISVVIIYSIYYISVTGIVGKTILHALFYCLVWMIFLPIYMFKFILLKTKRDLRKKKSQLDILKPKKLTLSEMGMVEETEDTKAECSWGYFQDVEETEHYYYLYRQDTTFILPKKIKSLTDSENVEYNQIRKKIFRV